MPFLETDLYLASGTGQLQNSWVDPVYKFDSSSFYNWEQDNLPIYDLEERDDLLFEMAGLPTSSVQGMMLTVSSCGVDNKKVFATITDAVSALPNTIRFPIIIEVATSGSLGELRLDDLQFEGAGAGLEIINRGFAKALCGSATPSATYETLDAESSSILTFSSIDLSTTMYESSALGVSTTVWDNNPDAASWWENYTRAFILTPEWSRNESTSVQTITISSKFKDSAGDFMGTTNQYNVDIYTDNSTSSNMQILNPIDSSLVQREAYAAPSDETRAMGMVYANSLTNAYINNCNGPVYIRGFCVDGASQASLLSTGTQDTSIGFDINNSDVVIENCTAARCINAGMQAVNSNVVLSRGFIAFHNYGLDSLGVAHLDTKKPQETPGLRAVNSTITLSSTAEEDKGLPIDSPFCFYRNKVGIDLQNSQLQTPLVQTSGKNVNGSTVTTNNGSQTTVLQTFFNTEAGVKATDSIINTGQRIASFQNKQGLLLDNSVVKVSEITADHNEEAGLDAANSTFNYNKDAVLAAYSAGPFYPQTSFFTNGQHVLLHNSRFVPTYVDAMDTVYTRLGFKRHFAANNLNGTTALNTLPAVVLDAGSFMDAVASKSQPYNVDGTTSGKRRILRSVKGYAFRVMGQSTLKLNGHKNDATIILGDYAAGYQKLIAGIYAGEQSTIEVAGPTTMAMHGVNALSEDNSTIAFGPHQIDGFMDVSGYSLDDTANHTMVQFHSTRASLVANRSSQIAFQDMGDYNERWDEKYRFNLAGDAFDSEYATSSSDPQFYGTGRAFDGAYCTSGSVRFFPNPYAKYGGGAESLNLEPQAHPTTVTNMDADSARTFSVIATAADIGDASYGGLCVRAVDDSEIKVRNVEFQCDWPNTSGAYYDASASECELLRIWNIADTSKLKMSFTSVNGYHPQDMSASYYGPSAVWVSGGAWTPLSGAPSSTPDTASLSVLDSFGMGTTLGAPTYQYGKTDFENVGPFRLYVSPDPMAKFLGQVKDGAGNYFIPSQYPAAPVSMAYNWAAGAGVASIETGVPYQVIAQGYNTSSDCSAGYIGQTNNIYNELGFATYINSLRAVEQVENDASSFFYTSAMLGDSADNIWLDEAGMNTFANAKNGTMSTSGRKPICKYYAAHTAYPGEAFWNTSKGVGLGSVNLFDLDTSL